MLNDFNNFILCIADPLLGWLLYLPQDFSLLLIALLTALTLTLVRLFTTNQSYLACCKRDKIRLKELIRAAKQAGDKSAVQRHRRTMGQIGIKRMSAEGLPLLTSIIPIAIFAVWAFSRIAYIAPQADEEITMNMYFPVSAIDTYVHIVPLDGVECKDSWIKKVVDDVVVEDGEQSGEATVVNGVASWTFVCKQRDEPYKLFIRHQDRSIEKELILNGKHYAQPMAAYGSLFEEVIEYKTEEYKLFGFIPGIPSLLLAPWMIGYLVFVLPLAFALKPILNIH